MHSVITAFRIGLRGLRKWTANPRITALALFMFFCLQGRIRPVAAFSKEVGIGVAPWLFPFLSGDLYFQSVVLFGAILLFCDAPFLDESAPYVIWRSGRYRWSCGQVLYILMGSAVYVLLIALGSVLLTVPHLELQEGWGKVLTTLAMTDAKYQYGATFITQKIYYAFGPGEAMGLSLTLTWMTVSFVGLLIYVLNSLVHKTAGGIVACGIVMMNYFIYNFLASTFTYYFPASVGNIAYLSKSDPIMNPTYALSYFGVALTVLSITAVLSIRGRNIETIQAT